MNITFRELFIKDFQAYMEDLDNRLNKKSSPILGRDFYALSEISKETGLQLTPIYQMQINNWYKNRYGNKLNLQCNTKMAILIKNIPYLIKFPIASYGKNEINIFNCICDLTENFLKSLSFMEQEEIANSFIINFERFQDNNFSEFVTYSNLDEAVSNIMAFRADSQTDGYGVSKWASLQLAEKAIKKYASLHNIDFDKIHKLDKLIKQVNIDIPTELINKIQCEPSIRYGKLEQEQTTLQEAIYAHHASLDLCWLLSQK